MEITYSDILTTALYSLLLGTTHKQKGLNKTSTQNEKDWIFEFKQQGYEFLENPDKRQDKISRQVKKLVVYNGNDWNGLNVLKEWKIDN